MDTGSLQRRPRRERLPVAADLCQILQTCDTQMQGPITQKSPRQCMSEG